MNKEQKKEIKGETKYEPPKYENAEMQKNNKRK